MEKKIGPWDGAGGARLDPPVTWKRRNPIFNHTLQSETTKMVGTIYIGGYTEDSLWNQGS